MTQRWIEVVIGRLLTDEEFRAGFETDPKQTIEQLVARGTDLTRAEIAALMSTDLNLWNTVAAQIDPRLQKASFKNPQD